MFNVDYETADLYKIAICKMAFTKTICQVESIEAVEFEMTNLINEEDIIMEEYDESSFINTDDMSLGQ
jgi:ribosomal protein S3AE